MNILEEMLEELRTGPGAQDLISADEREEIGFALMDYAFAYSKREGGETYCSACREIIPRDGAKHKETVECPCCGKELILWEEWRGHKYLDERLMIYLWSRSKRNPEVLYARCVLAEKNFGHENPETAPLEITVEALYRFEPGKAQKWTWDYYRTVFTKNIRGIAPEEKRHHGVGARHSGLPEAMEGTRIGRLAGKLGLGVGDNPYRYAPIDVIGTLARKPYLEYVLACGQEQLARDIIQNTGIVKNYRARSMPKLLGLTEGQWYEVRRDGIQLTYGILTALHAVQKAGNMTLTIADAVKLAKGNGYYHRFTLCERAPQLLAHIPPKLRRKAVRRAAFSDDASTWIDYWRQLRDLGEDMTDSRLLLPKDMPAMHQRMIERENALREQKRMEMNAMLQQDHDKRMRALKKRYCFEAEGLVLRPFRDAKEVVDEGKALHICIGGYAERYLKGKTILCCLRRAEAPDTPWRAVEFSATTGRLVQDRGEHNDVGTYQHNFDNGVREQLNRFWAAFRKWENEKSRRKTA